MNKIIIVILVAMVIFGGFKIAKDLRPIPKTIDMSGDDVTIHYGKVLIKAKMAPEKIDGFLVNNSFPGKNSDGWFFVTPMDKVKSLKAQYGDFVHCDSPGASAGKASLEMLILFTAEPEMREKIKKVIGRSLNSPIVEIRGSKLEITEHTIGDEPYSQFDPATPENYYLISDIRITQEHYQ